MLFSYNFDIAELFPRIYWKEIINTLKNNKYEHGSTVYNDKNLDTILNGQH